jgi:hypothetical protein
MKVYTCTEFQGHYPVGTAAVIVASSRKEAKEKLEKALFDHFGAIQVVKESDLVQISASKAAAHILLDGNY